MASSNKLIVAILAVAVVAVAFWMVLLSPRREEADKLSAEAGQLQASLVEARSKLFAAETAKRSFPADYRQLVVLGKAVPEGDETSSFLVEMSKLSQRSKVRFESITLEEGSGESVSETSGATVPATEAEASLLPLGAAVGPAGLGVLPYNLKFSGSFFHVADFIREVDSLVHTGKAMTIHGRLVTIDGFALTENTNRKFPYLNADFAITAYVTPPEQGVTAGATGAAPAPVAAPTEAPTATGEETAATTGSEAQ